ncbi:MAG: hypothetical protein AAB116_11455 [Candidatus Poribacteria bacterium]
MTNKTNFVLTLVLGLFCFNASPISSLAEDHPLSTIKGTYIDLKTYDHAIAGSLKDFVIWGHVDEATFSSELIMKKDGQIIKAFFKKENGQIGGVIKHTVESKDHLTSIYFKRLEKAENKLLFDINGQEVAVAITSEGFSEGHFLNPTYKAILNGTEVNYTLQGSACYGYSLHLAFLILGAYTHL